VSYPHLFLPKVPVLSVTSFTAAGSAVDATEYVLVPTTGEVRLGSWPNALPGRLYEPLLTEVVYTYGFDLDVADIPWSVKRPLIRATASLIKQLRPTKIPPTATEYRSRGAALNIRFERSQTQPWPWDEAMSAQVRAYWNPSRPRSYVS
jgi:hypothetical protein